MAAKDNLQHGPMTEPEDLSPVKRALVEIRRLRAELELSRHGQTDPIATIGLAVRLPGGVTSPDRFWKALAEGEDLITTVPPERWDAQAYWSADGDEPGTMYDIHGGFLSDVDAFDAEFFGIHPREAASMDPQQRILLELTWEALERAAIDPRSLMNTKTGIYLGLTGSDYSRVLTESPRRIDGYTGVGAALSIAAGRLAYFLGTHGPAVAIDTACSSSLVAVHQAVQSLRGGETDLAIVGAANLILSPEMNIGFSRTRMLSRSGRSRTFDASADGYVRSEGCCVVILKRMQDAVRDEDRIFVKIHGTAVNQDGRSAGITAPNGPAQEAVMRAALADAGLKPDAIGYVEAHGTGTPLGDPMEVHAIGEVYGEGRNPGSPLRIGSVKTNLGHTEAAAGLTGLIKIALMMQPGHGIAPHLHFKMPSPQIDWQRWPIEVPVRLTSWSADNATKYAGISSFGFSGTNAHIILGSVDTSAASHGVEKDPEAADPKESLLCLSAAHEGALRVLAQRYVEFLRQSGESFDHICYTAAVGRAGLAHRLALRADSAEAAAEMLEHWITGQETSGLMTSEPNGVRETDYEDALQKKQEEFVRGGTQHHAGTKGCRVELPVYPFQRKRFWFGESPTAKRQRERENAWHSARADAERQSHHGPLGWRPERFSEKSIALTKLTRAHAHNVLAEAGAFSGTSPSSLDDVLRKCEFQPMYRRLIKRWLSGLKEDGVLVQSGEVFSAPGGLHPVDLDPHWKEAARWMEDEPGTLAYLKQCGSLLGDVLAGRTSALETLFPDGSFALAEGLYETSAGARYFNSIVAASLRAATRCLDSRRNPRILEIGGGTGGTTSAVLPLLPREHAEYCFTDVSELFLNRARRKFSDYPFVRCALFDIDRDFEDQGFRSGMFDIVVAANVIHAARNLESALRRVQRLLAPGGLLILLETTHHQSWFDMSTGLIEGWQHFEDADRLEHPLLGPDQWQAILERTGFEQTLALPRADSPASEVGQHVLLARCRESSESYPAAVVASGFSMNAPDLWKAARSIHSNSDAVVSERIQGFTPATSEETVSVLVRETVCSVFQLEIPPEELGDRDRLSDLGMDSLIALELRSELSKRLGLEGKISSTIAFDTGTLGELVRALTALLIPQAERPSASAEPPSVRPARSEAQYHTAEQLEKMSDEEVEQLLRERLSKQ